MRLPATFHCNTAPPIFFARGQPPAVGFRLAGHQVFAPQAVGQVESQVYDRYGDFSGEICV